MPRTARTLMDGGTYHVLTRGNNGQIVFHEEADYQRYLQLLAASATPHSVQLHHFALMPNHVHLVLTLPMAAVLSKVMLSLNLTYALYYRKRHGYTGHLWQGRFKSLLIDRESYLLECGRYVELNPVRAGLVLNPGDYAWSSYRTYAEGIDNPLLTPNPLYAPLAATAAERQQRYRNFILGGLQQEPAPKTGRYGLLEPEIDPTEPSEELYSFAFAKRRPGRPRKLNAAAQK